MLNIIEHTFFIHIKISHQNEEIFYSVESDLVLCYFISPQLILVKMLDTIHAQHAIQFLQQCQYILIITATISISTSIYIREIKILKENEIPPLDDSIEDFSIATQHLY